jgi:hypothetical protein
VPHATIDVRRRPAIHSIALAAALVLAAGCGSTNEASGPVASGRTALDAIDAPGSEPRGTTGSTNAPDGATPGDPTTASTGSSDTPRRASDTTSVPSSGVRKPIEIGVLYPVNDAAESFGVDNGDTFSPSEVVRAFVKSYNASGGIGGRRIEAVYANLNSASNDYEAQGQAACATFTEDHHVAAVLSNLGYYSDTLLTCLARASVPVVSGDWIAPDRRDADRFPLFFTPDALLGEMRMSLVVDHLKTSGWLQSRHKIGVVIEDCPVGQRVYANGLAPALRRAGLTVASTFETRCFRSVQDIGAQASQMSSAVLRFRQAGVNRVAFVSQGAEANLVFLFSTVAQEQGWFPGYAVSSTALPEALALNMSDEQLVNVKGVGWLPAFDTQDLKQAPPTSTARRCLDRMKQLGITPASNTDYANIYGPCDSFGLYDALLRATNGDATPSVLSRAVRDLSDDYVSASTVGGKTTTSGGRIRPSSGRLFAFVAERSRFEYTSTPFAL